MIIKIGDYIKDFLEESKMSQTELAKEMNVSNKHINQLINNKTSLTIEIADKLSKVFKTSIDFWISLDRNMKREEVLFKEGNIKHLNAFGLEELIARNIIDSKWTINSMYDKQLEWYGVTNLFDYKNKIQNDENSHFKKFKDKPNAYVWIRECELKTQDTEEIKGIFRKARYELVFKNLLRIFRTKNTFDEKLKLIQSTLTNEGISIVYNKFISNSTIQGFSTIKSGKRYIYLSDMNKREYSIFFTVLHELTHLYNKEIDESFIDNKVVEVYLRLKEKGFEVKAIDDAIWTFKKTRKGDYDPSHWDILRKKYPSVSFK